MKLSPVFKTRRLLNTLAGGALLGATLSLALPAQAQSAYPNRPIKLVVPFVPGGTLDVAARMLARQLNDILGQPVLVENRGGSGGIVGVDHVAKSPPDGYTLLLNAATPMVTVVSLQKTPYDVLKDLTPVSQSVSFDYVLAVSTKTGINTMQELVAKARANPGKLNYSSAGTGSGQHMYMELAKNVAGISITHIPYRGSGPAMQAVLAGEVDMIFDTTLGILPQMQSGRLKPLLTSSAKPIPSFPGVPTMESLYRGSTILGWHGVFVPAGTPKEIVNTLSEAVRKAVNTPDVAARLRELGLEPLGTTPEQFSEVVRRDLDRWGQLIREKNIKAD